MSHSQINQLGAAAHVPPITAFSNRAASQNWELAPLAESPQLAVWVWFKPGNFPQGVAVNIPEATYRGYPQREQLTLRRLLNPLGLDPGCLAQWTHLGIVYDAQLGASPYLDQTIPDPVPGTDSNLYISVVAAAVAPVAQPAPAIEIEQGGQGDIFDNIASEWKAIEKTERDLGICRRKLSDMISRLSSLNRDLTHDEMMHADNADKTAWQDARRWLREVSARVTRYLKDCDIGDSTNVVRRQRMEQIYEQFVTQRQYFEGIQQAHREFEGYRKMVQTLHVNMNTALSSAATDGERRAQSVLSRISAKSRKKR